MSRKKSHQAKGPTQRQLRVGELIRHKLAEMLARGEIYDDVLASHVVTITEVRMSPDLRLATAYVMPLGGRDTKTVIEALARNSKFVRGEIAHAVDLLSAPLHEIDTLGDGRAAVPSLPVAPGPERRSQEGLFAGRPETGSAWRWRPPVT